MPKLRGGRSSKRFSRSRSPEDLGRDKDGNRLYHVRKSKIRGAGLGAFATQDISEGTVLGEYTGRRLTKKAFEKLDDITYVFDINRFGRVHHYIDGSRGGNWTRRINGAKNERQRRKVNVESYQYRQRIFIRASRDIKKGEEFIIDYGTKYWG